jgi:hypothetical protein
VTRKEMTMILRKRLPVCMFNYDVK